MMMNPKLLETTVGAFIVLGVLALLFLSLNVSGLSIKEGTADTYRLYAHFDNAGSLSPRSKVSMAGVTIGRVVNIDLDKKTYMANVAMDIFKDVDNIPIDSTASISTSGLIGDQYVNISIGGESEYLVDGELFDDTQSAMVLEDLIGKFLFNATDSSDTQQKTNETTF